MFGSVIFIEFKLSKTFLEILRPNRPPHHDRFDFENRPPRHHRRPRHYIMGLKPPVFVALAFSTPLVLLFILHHLLSLYLFRKAANQTRNVLQELKAGNLKARFPKDGKDNLGIISNEVNDMADELEKLVLSLEDNELKRKNILQELVHDLRTPITSLNSMLELLRDHHLTMKHAEIQSFYKSSISEVKYFERLISDLLVISDLTDNSMVISVSEIDVKDILQNLVSSFKTYGKTIDINLEDFVKISFMGNKQQIRRLFQNAIDNAVSFATSKIEIKVAKNKFFWTFIIRDDGVGISKENQLHFGDKFRSRVVSQTNDSRISIGLGAVIMKKIVIAHGGELSISNRDDKSGAKLQIVIPTTF